MKYKKVGKMALEMSALGYGCWGASGQPSWGGHTDLDQIKAIQAAIDGGINFFDVAPVYGLGHAEEVLGQAIKGKRNDIYIATKCGLPWNENKQVRNDVRPEAILKEIDESLIRLGVDHVDLYQVHWPTADGVAIEDTAKALASILETGKARYVGLSNYSIEDAKTFNKYVEIASMQGLYNMIEQNAESYHGYRIPRSTSLVLRPQESVEEDWWYSQVLGPPNKALHLASWLSVTLLAFARRPPDTGRKLA